MSTAQRDVVAPFRWREAGEIRWLAADLGHAQAAFSTRSGGASEGPYRSLNLGILTDDEPQRVRRNRKLLAQALEREELTLGRQVHGTDVQVRERPDSDSAPLTEADAQLTTHADLTPLVLVADCVPLAIAAPNAVAMVHCGWRGLAAGIVEQAVAALREQAACEPRALRAAIGPGIGPCCYEVGEDVARAFASDQRTLDLPAIVRAELERAGVPALAVAASELCTSCNPDLFFSHRRDGGTTGRQAGLAWLH